MEYSSSSIAKELSELAGDRAHFFLQDDELVCPNGPAPIVHSYLTQKGGESLRTKSARAYFLVQYALLVSRTAQSQREKEPDSELDAKLEATVTALLPAVI